MMDPEHSTALERLAEHLHQIGSANDAEDHGYVNDAKQMRLEACFTIRDLLEKSSFICELLPRLTWELETEHILGFGWSQLLDDLEPHLAASKKERPENADRPARENSAG